VEFTLADGRPAKLELLDVAGRALMFRQVGSLGPGHHSVDLSSGGALPPGIYFLRLTQGRDEVRARATVLRCRPPRLQGMFDLIHGVVIRGGLTVPPKSQ
jgi:hypothetical protein